MDLSVLLLDGAQQPVADWALVRTIQIKLGDTISATFSRHAEPPEEPSSARARHAAAMRRFRARHPGYYSTKAVAPRVLCKNDEDV